MARDRPCSIFRRCTSPGEAVILEDSHASADVENYHLLQSIGVGAYAKVYKSKVLSTGAVIAAKIVNKGAAPADYVKKFLPREIAILQVIHHPCCTQTYEIFSVGEKIHMIMELAPNGDVLDYINSRGRINEPTAQKMFSQLVSALEYFYSMSIAHRDLKCENLLLDEQFNIKVSDFGFATTYGAGQMLKTFCGSVAYACPEILYGEPYDGKYSDLWSIGVVLYALVCGQLPFQEGNMKRLLMQINSPLVVPGRLTSDCIDLLRRLLATDIRRRATLKDVQMHPWLQPINPARQQITIPEHKSPAVKRREQPDTTLMEQEDAGRKRSSTIDAAELGAKPKQRLDQPGLSPVSSPVVTRKNGTVLKQSPTGGGGGGSGGGFTMTASTVQGFAGKQAHAGPQDTAMDCEPPPSTRGRAMTGSAAPSELARQVPWRKRIRQNITQYMSHASDHGAASKKKSRESINAITE